MSFSKDIVLRPRFSLAVNSQADAMIQKFREEKVAQKDYKISIVEQHVFISLPKNKQRFWSPQLHLEMFENENDHLEIKGFFGPNPTVWTMFIFFHVVIGILFIANLIWIYSNHTLNIPYDLQVNGALGLFAAWVALYIAGSIGKRKGKPEMRQLYNFMTAIVAV